MKLVSPLLKHVVYPGLAKTGYLRRSAGAGLAVVTYHGVLPEGYRRIDPVLDGSLVTTGSLRQQLSLLKRQYNVISPQQFQSWCDSGKDLPRRSVLLTCDDGLCNVLTDMLPVLQELELSCLFFVTGAFLSDAPAMLWYEELELMLLSGQETFAVDLPELGLHRRIKGSREKIQLWLSLVKNLSPYASTQRRVIVEKLRIQLGLGQDWNTRYLGDSRSKLRFFMLNVLELRQLAAAGMSIGAHTLSHPMLSQLSSDMAWTEIAESRRSLETALGQTIWALAYPFGNEGSITQRELAMAERAGFKCAFVNAGGGFGAATPRFALPRVHVTADMSLAEFEAHVSGFYRTLRKCFLGENGRVLR